MDKTTNLNTQEVYDQHTFNSKNLLARFAHRARYQNGISIFENVQNIRLLDFGTGDGRFLHHLSEISANNTLVGYEPFMESKLFNNVAIYKKLG